MGLRAGGRRRSQSFGEWRVWWWMWAGGRRPSCSFAEWRVCGKVNEGPRARLRSRGLQWGMWGRPKPSRLFGELRVQRQVRWRPYTRLESRGRVRVDETPHARLESIGCGGWCGWATKAFVLVCRAEGCGGDGDWMVCSVCLHLLFKSFNYLVHLRYTAYKYK
jgi:hypothetical protein